MNDTIDIVDRLRIAWTSCSQKINDERNAAADEIERLRAERDEARRNLCLSEAAVLSFGEDGIPYHPSVAHKIATDYGWDCFRGEHQ